MYILRLVVKMKYHCIMKRLYWLLYTLSINNKQKVFDRYNEHSEATTDYRNKMIAVA